MRRRFEYKDRELEDFLIRFYPAGNYTWIVPKGCREVDVFLVGGGGAGHNGSGGVVGISWNGEASKCTGVNWYIITSLLLSL